MKGIEMEIFKLKNTMLFIGIMITGAILKIYSIVLVCLIYFVISSAINIISNFKQSYEIKKKKGK